MVFMLSESFQNTTKVSQLASVTPTEWISSYQLSSVAHPCLTLCQPTISSSVIPFSSCLQSFPASGSFPVSQFFISGGQRIEVSASASVCPMNIQNWFPLGLTGLISLQFKGFSRVFSNTTVEKCQFFAAQLSLCSNSHSSMTTGKEGNGNPLQYSCWENPKARNKGHSLLAGSSL